MSTKALPASARAQRTNAIASYEIDTAAVLLATG
jgi:hypothetical protein